MTRPPKSPVVRIAMLAAAFLLLVLGGVTLLMHKPASEDGPRFAVQRMVGAFESKDMDGFLAEMEFPLRAGWRPEPYDEDSLRRELSSAWAQLAYISIAIENISIKLGEGGTHAVATVEFHWTVSNQMYPNARARSKDYNDGGRPEVARIALQEGPDGWKVVNVMELSRH